MPVPGVRASLQTMGCPGETETLLGRMIRLIKGDAGGRRIYVMSDLLSDAFPLVNYSDARWVSRFPSLWILPGLYPGGRGAEEAVAYRPMDEASDLERYLINAVVSDLRRGLPALLIVDVTPRKPRFAGRRFDYLEYLLPRPAPSPPSCGITNPRPSWAGFACTGGGRAREGDRPVRERVTPPAPANPSGPRKVGPITSLSARAELSPRHPGRRAGTSGR